ncbi:Uu.00g060050.m01.CDS01 [Anthostomella pinea]|uniref:Vacuolar ATPase assembly protein VMA22 n=1 Tax=Anthostomella pinea TaxID=933095 RepID=A0AAI8VLL7_9PEZI|nr:Uu.00g060050.m01.CDS01 [Anthostomella pinea]
MDTEHIDTFLERYLLLLHEYASLREQLSSLQTGIYQNIARANFAAERGMRFGQDYYDERMQASRRLAITTDDDQGAPSFAIKGEDSETEVQVTPEPTVEDSETESKHVDDAADGSKKQEAEEVKTAPKKRRDPLKWFGLFTPTPLRQAQAQSVQAIEEIIPKLVSVNAQMAQVEIEVRRARKKRAKAEAAAAKQEQVQESGGGREIVA